MSTTDHTPGDLGPAPARSSDPQTSHDAAAVAAKRVPTKLAIERVLAAHGKPLTADEIWNHLRYNFGYKCSHERVRTVLNEGAGLSRRSSARFNAFVRLPDTAPSELGNPSHLWALAGAA